MRFKKTQQRWDWEKAEKHLRKVDPVMKQIIGRVGKCGLKKRRDCFAALCQAIFSQQVSTVVAEVLFGRFKKLFEKGRITAEGVKGLSEQQLRGVGASRQKVVYLKDLAKHFLQGKLAKARWSEMEDEEIIEALMEVKGIGRWTAEMFLIFVLNRADVLPVDDLGLRKGVQKVYGMKELPGKSEVMERGEKWRPWRSVGTWYVWRSL